jgi:hypothetical protein
MSSVPHSRPAPQGPHRLYRPHYSPQRAERPSLPPVIEVARRLTPLQRQLLVRAGMPRWLRLPHPWQPAPGRQAAAAEALCSSEWSILEPVGAYLGAYHLTTLGEQVAGIWLLSALALP